MRAQRVVIRFLVRVQARRFPIDLHNRSDRGWFLVCRCDVRDPFDFQIDLPVRTIDSLPASSRGGRVNGSKCRQGEQLISPIGEAPGTAPA